MSESKKRSRENTTDTSDSVTVSLYPSHIIKQSTSFWNYSYGNIGNKTFRTIKCVITETHGSPNIAVKIFEVYPPSVCYGQPYTYALYGLASYAVSVHDTCAFPKLDSRAEPHAWLEAKEYLGENFDILDMGLKNTIEEIIFCALCGFQVADHLNHCVYGKTPAYYTKAGHVDASSYSLHLAYILKLIPISELAIRRMSADEVLSWEMSIEEVLSCSTHKRCSATEILSWGPGQLVPHFKRLCHQANKRKKAANMIIRHWRICINSPEYLLGRKRIQKLFDEVTKSYMK